jgi:hypothetical protein
MSKKVEIELRLPTKQIESLNKLAKFAGVSVGSVISVLLALHVLKIDANDSFHPPS